MSEKEEDASAGSPPKKADKKIHQKLKSFIFARRSLYMLLLSSAMVVLAYVIYEEMTSHPDVPQIDFEQWWGSYPLETKPDTSIRPFEIKFDDVMVNDLRERLLHQRPFTPPLEDSGSTYGFNTIYLTQILDYWKNKYNFREREDYLNRYNHYKTKIQGLDIHFMRVRPAEDSGVTVVPLLMLHGWPGSFREYYEIIPKLITPRDGYKFAFDVIVPSLPGFGYSEGAIRSGLGPVQMAVVMHNLMQRIGYKGYYIHGGDVGHAVGSSMATLLPTTVLGLHTSTPLVIHKQAMFYYLIGSVFPSWVVERPELAARLAPLTDHLAFLLQESGFTHMQATKPDTIGVALTDSPAGLAAYILEKFSTWTNPQHLEAADGNLLQKFSLNQLLDNVMIYWASNSITTSMRVYKEAVNNLALQMDGIPTPVPTACIKFKHDIIYTPDIVLKQKYTNYLQSTAVEDGGHFAAMEMPDILADDIFEAVGKFLEFHGNKSTKQKLEPPIWETAKTIYEFTVTDIHGKKVTLDRYRGHVAVIVNVASQCGLTQNNYKQLNELYERYSVDKGLRILAFPCNQFGGQEPGGPEAIFNFAKDRGVKFDLFQKVEVNGENAHPLWKFLKRSQSGTIGDFIKWNFSKFIIDKNGVPVERLAPTVDPEDLVPYLAKYW
ncbi:hypothetical protein O0L34_g3349 [Tuta absoluta]|nr:hypothetical protein O0L34_g3349 [Tuta absoluta]